MKRPDWLFLNLMGSWTANERPWEQEKNEKPNNRVRVGGSRGAWRGQFSETHEHAGRYEDARPQAVNHEGIEVLQRRSAER